jgi:hypothetical protein
MGPEPLDTAVPLASSAAASWPMTSCGCAAAPARRQARHHCLQAMRLEFAAEHSAHGADRGTPAESTAKRAAAHVFDRRRVTVCWRSGQPRNSPCPRCKENSLTRGESSRRWRMNATCRLLRWRRCMNTNGPISRLAHTSTSSFTSSRLEMSWRSFASGNSPSGHRRLPSLRRSLHEDTS